MEKNIGPISILIPYYFCVSLLANKGCKFSLLPPVGRRRALMGLLRVALRFEFENPVELVHSCVHDRLRPREMIGFNDNSRYLSRNQMRGYV